VKHAGTAAMMAGLVLAIGVASGLQFTMALDKLAKL
jgi:hypothetical protein